MRGEWTLTSEGVAAVQSIRSCGSVPRSVDDPRERESAPCGAPAAPEDFDPGAHGLKQVSIMAFHGLIFINLDPAVKSPDEQLEDLSRALDIYQLDNTRVALQQTFPVAANWKLAIENYMECYHCSPAHTEYSRIHAMRSPADSEKLRPAMEAEAVRLGYHTAPISRYSPADSAAVPHYYCRSPL